MMMVIILFILSFYIPYFFPDDRLNRLHFVRVHIFLRKADGKAMKIDDFFAWSAARSVV